MCIGNRVQKNVLFKKENIYLFYGKKQISKNS